MTVLGYLKKAGQSVSINDLLATFPVQTLSSRLSTEDVAISQAMFVYSGVPSTEDETSAGETLPTKFVLFQNYPNPFNAGTEIKFNLPLRTRVALKIFNIRGELVRTLVDEDRAPGQYCIPWDGADEHASPVASGIYMYRIQTPEWQTSRKLTLVK